MKNRPLTLLILALMPMMFCHAQTKTSSTGSYRDDAFLKLLADTTAIAEERHLSDDGDNPYVYYSRFFNLLPVEISFADEQLNNMHDFYNLCLIARDFFCGYDTYFRESHMSGDDNNTELVKAWKASVKQLRNQQVFHDSTVQQQFQKVLEEGIDSFIQKSEDEELLKLDDLFELLTQWHPMNKIEEEDEDSVWTVLQEKLHPQNYMPDGFHNIYTTYLEHEAAPTKEEMEDLFKCYRSAENLNQKSACLFTLMGIGTMKSLGRDTLERFIKEAETLFESAAYTPMLPLLWRAYRCLYNDTYSCPSKDCYIFNQRYNYYRKLVAYTYLRHIQATQEDEMAKFQYFFHCFMDDILKEGEYLFGNQTAAEVINLFWNRSVF